jgi:NAD(P)-dependent dehydrogenase (short-subunit alcohol dehydrogenase family)
VGLGSNSHRGMAMAPIYSFTKAAVAVMCNALAPELAPKEITVNTVHPGPTRTGKLCHLTTRAAYLESIY